MKPDQHWYRDPPQLFGVVPLTIIVCVLLAWMIGFDRLARMTSSDWAAWVQAVGSIGAIAGVEWTIQAQHQLATDVEMRQLRRQVASTLAPHREAIEFIRYTAMEARAALLNPEAVPPIWDEWSLRMERRSTARLSSGVCARAMP